MRAGTARPTGERSQMTVAGVVSVVLIAVAAALVIYLLVALVDPERF
ncbi:K+-transporting ATPase, F subunit [Rhodococcus erythropolis SK121]|nr:K+-transporting ATPase, F subunit [Rhodococcus erythropolis SK121]